MIFIRRMTIRILQLALVLIFFSGCTNSKKDNDMKSINIIALMQPKEGKANELRDSLLALVKPTHSEEGCITYSVYEEENGSLFLHEVWRSQEDLDKHLKKAYLIHFVSKIDSLLDGKNDAHFGKLISNSPDLKSNTSTPKTVYIASIKRPKEGKANELRNSLLALVKPTLSEEGCLAYDIYEENDGTLFMYEAWRSQEDLDKHLQQPYLKDFKSKSEDLIESNTIRFGKLISSKK